MWCLLCTGSIERQGRPSTTLYLFSGSKNRYGFDDHISVYLAVIKGEESNEDVRNEEAQSYGWVKRILTRNMGPKMDFGLMLLIEVTNVINQSIGSYWLVRCIVKRKHE